MLETPTAPSPFREEYRKARGEAVQQSVARLQQATGAASVTMLKLMTDANMPGAIRLRAAGYVLDYAIKGVRDGGPQAGPWCGPLHRGSPGVRAPSYKPLWRRDPGRLNAKQTESFLRKDGAQTSGGCEKR